MGYRRQCELKWWLNLQQERSQQSRGLLQQHNINADDQRPCRPGPLQRNGLGIPPPRGIRKDGASIGSRPLVSIRSPRIGAAKELQDRVVDWTPHDVCNWMSRSIGIPANIVAAFRDAEISGVVLLALTEEDLIQLGMNKFGWRKQFRLALEELKKGTDRPADVMSVGMQTEVANLSSRIVPDASAIQAAPKPSAAEIVPTSSSVSRLGTCSPTNSSRNGLPSHVVSSCESGAEYWQDVTAHKAKDRSNCKLSLSECSRRGVQDVNGWDIDDPPLIAQAKGKEEHEAEMKQNAEEAEKQARLAKLREDKTDSGCPLAGLTVESMFPQTFGESVIGRPLAGPMFSDDEVQPLAGPNFQTISDDEVQPLAGPNFQTIGATERDTTIGSNACRLQVHLAATPMSSPFPVPPPISMCTFPGEDRPPPPITLAAPAFGDLDDDSEPPPPIMLAAPAFGDLDDVSEPPPPITLAAPAFGDQSDDSDSNSDNEAAPRALAAPRGFEVDDSNTNGSDGSEGPRPPDSSTKMFAAIADISEQSGEEYWQDVTAHKVANREESRISLSMCSRRGFQAINGWNIDDPPERAQALARIEEEEERKKKAQDEERKLAAERRRAEARKREAADPTFRPLAGPTLGAGFGMPRT